MSETVAVTVDGGVGAVGALTVVDALRLLADLPPALEAIAGHADSVQTVELAGVAGLLAATLRTSRGALVAVLDQAQQRGVPREQGSSDLGTWLEQIDPMLPQPDVRSMLRALTETSPPVLATLRQALLRGEVGPADAVSAASAVQEVIPAVTAPGADGPLAPSEIAAREEHAVSSAIVLCRDGFGRRDLAAWKAHLMARFAPERLDRESIADASRVSLSAFRQRYDGLHEATLVLDTPSMSVVRAVVDALAAPMPAADGSPDPRTAGQRRAQALVEVVTASAASGRTGPLGAPARLLLTASVADIEAQVPVARTPRRNAATVITGQGLVALLCDADITGVVTDSSGRTLDVGRTKRLATARQRDALALRDGGCTFPGCTRPPDWCRAHHITHWRDGGTTDLANLTLLCERHHTFVHQHKVQGRVRSEAGQRPSVQWDLTRGRRGWRPSGTRADQDGDAAGPVPP